MKNLLRLYRETGNVIPFPNGGGQTPKLKATGLKFLKNTVEKSPDLSIEEYTQIYNDNEEEEESVSASTIGRSQNLPAKKINEMILENTCQSNQLKTKLYQLALQTYNPEQLIYRRGYRSHYQHDTLLKPVHHLDTALMQLSLSIEGNE